MVSFLLSKLKSAATPFVFTSTASWAARRHAILYSENMSLKENGVLMEDMEEAGGYMIVPLSFFTKPRRPQVDRCSCCFFGADSILCNIHHLEKNISSRFF